MTLTHDNCVVDRATLGINVLNLTPNLKTSVSQTFLFHCSLPLSTHCF